MKNSNNHIDEERQLLETIHKISRQINFSEFESGSLQHSKFLIEVIEHLELQLKMIRSK